MLVVGDNGHHLPYDPDDLVVPKAMAAAQIGFIFYQGMLG